MSDNKTPAPKSTDTKLNKSKSNGKPPAGPTKTSRKPIYVFAGLFTLALVLIAGYFQYRVEILIGENSALEQHLKLLDQQSQSQLEKSIQQATRLNDINSMNQKLEFMQQTLNQIPGARLDDWKLAEVEYLLRLGNQRSALQHELTGAWALFNAANDILASLDDPGLLLVREKIAQEMLLLGNESSLDRQGIYTQLQAIKSQVHQNIQPPQNYSHEQSATQEITGNQDLWAQLTSLVNIRYSKNVFDAPLSAQQYQILEHSLTLILEQAQWALLKADQKLYESSLENAISWISSKLRHHQALALSNEIQLLKNINIQKNIPDVSGSLVLLRQIQNDRIYQPSNKNTIPAEKTSSQKSANTEVSITKATSNKNTNITSKPAVKEIAQEQAL